MRTLGVFDTTVCDDNLGNEIIMQAVYQYLRSIYEHDFFIKLPYLDTLGINTIQYIISSDLVFFGGTNSLSSEMNHYSQWGINRLIAHFIKNKVVLMGVGWWQYQGQANSYTKNLLKTVLQKDVLHSVRDSYTEEKLHGIGIHNVVNTGCPTIWGLNKEHCMHIPVQKANDVLITFTQYNQNIVRDTFIVNVVRENYKNIYCWIQSPRDYDYIKKLCPEVRTVLPSVRSLEDFISKKQVDYVGTRLHAGIKCLQYQKRSLVVGIDNRALEMKKDFNLPVLPEESLSELSTYINSKYYTDIDLPADNIKFWLGQFGNESNENKKCKLGMMDKALLKIMMHF